METETMRPPLAELYAATAETERRVLELVTEVADPESALGRAFYGPQGIEPTPLTDAYRPMAGHVALLKDETRHRLSVGGQTFESGSFKRRGALLAALVACQGEDQPDTFVTASQGNHAIAVAMAAKTLGKQTAIYCPSTLSPIMRQKLEELGAKVHTEGLDTLEDALAAALLAGDEPGSHMIHPFNQAEVIAGQATVGLEIVRDLERMAAAGQLDLHRTPIEINVAVGGGGFIAGVAIVLRHFKNAGIIGDNVRLVGSQMVGCDAARRSVEDLRDGGYGLAYFQDIAFNPACNSTAVTDVGRLALPFLADPEYVQEFRLVTPAELGRGMRTLTGIYHRLVEPAGSLAYTSARKGAAERAQLSRRGEEPTIFIVPVCGANVTREKYQEFQGYDLAEYAARTALLAEQHRLGRAAVLARWRQASPVPAQMATSRVWSGATSELYDAIS